jgi:hypothetical protein
MVEQILFLQNIFLQTCKFHVLVPPIVVLDLVINKFNMNKVFYYICNIIVI